ncbi:hypothetical protein PoB_001763900 [Plakobranchus ocellatus]|uniref:Uncharacterized protein n=1 Tax=Plakobranchus ocellatus TaxID=259542 RepID=A0AAV3ZB07_9GAST|nr:hypothetical protein PoB_001763900 [Plakobranchus ocellatus]
MNGLSVILTTAVCMLIFSVCGCRGATCSDLENCEKRIQAKTWFFLYPNYDTAEYKTKIASTCANTDLSCVDAPNDCTDSSYRTAAKVAKEKRTFICSNDGRTMIQELPAETKCFGNTTALTQIDNHRLECYATYLTPMSGVDCTAIENARLCDKDYGLRNCGPYTRFLIDRSWLARIKAEWPSCYALALATKEKLP